MQEAYYPQYKIPQEEKIEIDLFALSLTDEFICEMSERKRDYVKSVYLEIEDSPERLKYLPAALNEALKCCDNVDLGLFWFRKNYSLLEETFLVH
jgi:hypothetical protein